MRAAILLLLGVCAWAQTAPKATYKAPRLSDGHPDLQGIWTNATVTPLERPAELAGKAFLADLAEATAFEKRINEANNADRRRPADQDVGQAYNEAWYDRGTRVVPTLRTSLVIDPPDGHVPALTAEGQARGAAIRQAAAGHQNDGPEGRSLAERCLVWPNAGPPMLSSFYNNNYQVVQSPGYVAIQIENIHDVRMIPTDGSAHLPQSVRQWLGDPRGHWEGDTLVVETTNFTDKTRYRGSSDKLKLTERFTRTAPDILMYEFTVDDPSTFTKPWTAQIPMRKSTEQIYEYACHEGNYAMTDMLAGARHEEELARKK